MKKNNFINIFNMLNPSSRDIVSENAFPTSIQYHNICYCLGKHIDYSEMRINMSAYLSKCHTGIEGLYNQFPQSYMDLPIFINEKDKYTSKDQLMAMLCLLFISRDYMEINAIYRYLKKHWGFYNNVPSFWPKFRYMGRQAILTAKYFDEHCYGTSCEDDLYDLCFDQILKDKDNPERSTGALKAFTVLSSIFVRFNKIEELRKLIIFLKGEFKEFYESDHPIRKLLIEVELWN